MPQTSPNQLLEQASTLAQAGQQTEAIKLLYQTVQQYPSFYPGWLLFSRCLFETGHLQEAVQVAVHAETIDPFQTDFEKLQAFMQRRQHAEAVKIAQQILSQQAHHPKAVFTLARIVLVENQPELSINLLEQEVTFVPANISVRRLLGDSYAKAGCYSKAVAEAKMLVKLDGSFENHLRLLRLLFKYGQYDDFMRCWNNALALKEVNSAQLSQLTLLKGQVLRIIGKRQESIESLKSSLSHNPQNAEAWWALADFKNYPFTDNDKHQLESLLNSNLNAETRCLAAFAYAKLSESSAKNSGNLAHYHTANALKPGANSNMASAVIRELGALPEKYPTQSLVRQANTCSGQKIPVFIVGLPRSGSTLIEQILASHSEIEGTMEQPTLLSIEQRANRRALQHYNGSLHNVIGSFSADELSALGQAYLNEGALFRTNQCRFFTDKQPFNFRLVGLIHKILPQAVIIDVVRNPMDCGLSLYKQYFHSGVDFSYDLKHIAEVYSAYNNLMQHWDSVLPGKVLRVSYESLVLEPEQQVRRILQHIGLDYQADCLSFHTTNRAIHTASSEQVRQPINRNGIGTWIEFESELALLKQGLEPDLMKTSLALKPDANDL